MLHVTISIFGIGITFCVNEDSVIIIINRFNDVIVTVFSYNRRIKEDICKPENIYF